MTESEEGELTDYYDDLVAKLREERYSSSETQGCNEETCSTNETERDADMKDEQKFEVGDEIKDTCYGCGCGVVTRVYGDTLTVTWLEDGTNGVIHAHAVEKTGKHYPQIAELFDKPLSKEKCIELLQSKIDDRPEWTKAVRMAVEALENKSKESSTTFKSNFYCITIQQAIDLLKAELVEKSPDSFAAYALRMAIYALNYLS